MPTYKLIYFDIRGLAEPARQLFQLAGVPFEDKRYGHGDGSFDKDKSKMPFGQLPVLEVAGTQIPQSSAICRYLARKFGYAGKTPEEEAMVDAIVDQWKDFGQALRPLFIAKRTGKSVDEIEKITKETYKPAQEAWFKILNGLLEKSTSGWLVGDKITWADLTVVDSLVTLEKFGFWDPKVEKRLAALKKKVHSAPKLKEYIATRKDSEY